jgi:hypothetical protein
MGIMRSLSTCLLFLSIATLACGSQKTEPTAPTSGTSEPASTASSSTPTASATPSAEINQDPPKKRKPFEVYSACTDVATIVFGEESNTERGKKTIAPSSTVEGPRDPNGNQVVWLLDPKGEPIVKVTVTKGMKRVEIGRSCRTLDAR